jgi:hypothetical protein
MRALTLFAGRILAALAVIFLAGLATAGAASASETAVARAGGTAAASTATAMTATTASATPATAAATATATADPGGSVAACTEYAYQAIRARVRITGIPAACQGLSPSQVTFAASTAIRMASAVGGSKSAWRKQTASAAPWVSSLLTGPAPAPSTTPGGAGSAGGTGGAWSRLGFSDFVAQVGGLLAWLAAAAAGGWILLRWWLAGGGHGARRGLRRLLHGSASTAPPAVTVGHVGFGLLGLVLWAIFMITGWAPLAWVCVGLLAPVAGLGMTVLLLGLPSPRDRAGDDEASAGIDGGTAPVSIGGGAGTRDDVRGGTAVLEAPAGPSPSTSTATATSTERRRRGGMPVIAIAAHGVFITIVIMFVILAAIGAG